MLVTTNQKRQRLNNDNLDLNFNNEPLTMITNEKILGVYVDNNLTWSEHIKRLTRKIASSISWGERKTAVTHVFAKIGFL